MALSKQRESPKESGPKTLLSTIKDNKKLVIILLCPILLAIVAARIFTKEQPPQIGPVQTARIEKPDGHTLLIEWIDGIETPSVIHDPDCPGCRFKRIEETKNGILQVFDSLQVQITD